MKVFIKNLQKKIPINAGTIRKIVLRVLSLEKVKKPAEITILFVDNRQIRELNLMYLGRDCPTDVISFDDSLNRRELLADIVVSTDAARRNARIFKTTPLSETYLYVVHGLLHLLGYDDKTRNARKIMQDKAENLLR